jgi:alpha-D-xyloside xylohydrolase
VIEIIHTPHGLEHPYEQLPEERFPREPLAGESFVVGIATRPPGAAGGVRVYARVDDQPEIMVQAARQEDWRPRLEEGVGAEFLERMIKIDQDVWHAALTAPEAGQTLTYRIEADDTAGPAYAYRPAAWQPDARSTRFIREGQNGVCTMDVTRDGPSAVVQARAGLPDVSQVEWLTDGKQARRVRLTFDCSPDEAFYGLGERYNALNQRGEVLDVRCYEQYKSQGKRTYMPIPFLLSSAGYGVYVESARWMQFDLAASQADRWALEADLGPDEGLRLHWFTGDDPLEIVGQFTRMTGTPAMPPLWAFGLWMSGNEWNSQARVLAEVEQSFAHDIVPSVLVIEAWSDESTFYIWNDAEYTPRPGAEMFQYEDFTFPAGGKWPDPRGMVDQLHEQDIRLLLWQVPALKLPEEPHPQQDADRAYFEVAGLGVREADGSLYKVRPFWFRDGYLWDVTNPAAREWWLGKRAYLLDELGIDGFKTDGGEHLWGRDTQFSDGRTGAELWNEYPKLYSEAYYQVANEKRNGEALTFSRAGFVGSQTAPAHWAGDEHSTWEAFRASILAGLSAGLSGIPFWGWDLGGFSGEIPSAELYLRGAAMAAFCPIMQYHSEFNQHREPNIDRTPWNIQVRTGDDRVIPAFRFFVNVRHNLMPYIWQEAQHAAATGQPLMRALQLQHAAASPYQYMFGRDLLVTPVVAPDCTMVDVFLPPGKWHDLWTGKTLTGGQSVEVAAPLDRIPVFVRDGASIPVRFGPDNALGEFVPLSAEANQYLGSSQ